MEISASQSTETPELEAIGSQAAYEAFLGAARALAPDTLEECRTDVALAYYNVKYGVENVLGSAAVVVGKLPNVNIEELSMLPRLAQGLAYATLQVHRELRATSFATLFERALHLRRKLSKAADALTEANLLPMAEFEEARLHSRLDVVEECVALAALFQGSPGLTDARSPVTKADLHEVEQVTRKLRALLGSIGETEDGGVPIVKAIEMRDRFWTLLLQRHDLLWRCGAWLYGRAVDERVPPLPLRPAGHRRVQHAPSEREAVRAWADARPPVPPRANAPGRVSIPSNAPTREAPRALSDLERKTRFLIRFGVMPPSR